MGALPFTGSLTGTTTGNLTGDVTGGPTGSLTGSPTGCLTGCLNGTMASSLVHGLFRAVGVLRAAGLEVAILAGHVLLYPTGVLPERPTPTPRDVTPDDTNTALAGRRQLPDTSDGQPPVLLLHGFVDNRSVFTLLRRSLRRNGWEHIEGFSYSPLTCDIRHAAAMLGHHVERLCERSGHQQVDIVGHSLGGLIARYYVQRLNGHVRVRALVTLGTPHSGTQAIPLANRHPIVRQMRPDSELMTELARPAAGCTTYFTAFWSDCDQLMIPVGAARLEHPDLVVRNIAVRGMGHLTMPVNGAVVTRIRAVLQCQEQASSVIDAA